MSAQKILDKQTKDILAIVNPLIAGYYQGYMLDLDRICAREGITLYQAKFENDNMSGALSRDDGQWSIVVNEDHSPRRRRFTIAHELGHYFAIQNGSISAQEYLEDNNDVIRDYYVLNRTTDVHDDIYDTERQANMIAAEVLMPEEMVRALIDEKKNLREMAGMFGVSESAMSYRLEGLGINTIETLT